MNITSEELEQRAMECHLPPYMIEGLVAYVLTGRPVGNFLTAVLSNNLKEACAYADGTNTHLLSSYVFFLYNYCPMKCWGSPELVEDWITQKGLTHAQPFKES